MKIGKITLTNYRLYKGVNTISFNNVDGRNVVLISGQNGFGKTTFLQSLIWCLYGKQIASIDDIAKKDINAYGYLGLLKSNLNRTRLAAIETIDSVTIAKIRKSGYSKDLAYLKDHSIYSVRLEFINVSIPSIQCRSLSVKRSFDYITEKEYVEILIDGNPNELTNEIGEDVFINDFILNKDLAQFFFFDAEKIVKLAEIDTLDDRRKLCSAYNEVLGVKKYEVLKKNLEAMRLKFRRTSSDIASRTELENMLSDNKILEEDIHDIQEQIDTNILYIQKLKEQDSTVQEELLRAGSGNTQEDITRTKSIVEACKIKDIEYKKLLKQFIDYAPFAIVGSLLNEVKQQMISDYAINQKRQQVGLQKGLVTQILSELSSAMDGMELTNETKSLLHEKFVGITNKYVVSKVSENTLLDFGPEDYKEFESIYLHLTTTYKSDFDRLVDDYKKNKQILERNSRKLSNFYSKEKDDVVSEIRNRKAIIESEIKEKENQAFSLHQRLGSLDSEVQLLSRKISDLSKKVTLDDSNLKKDALAEQLIDELNAFLVNLKKEKKYSLERRIQEILNSLMHKEDFISKVNVSIENDVMEIGLFGPDGQEVKKESLSKGEQQLYASSILKALVDESGLEFPVFIDSPLQKFDKSHSAKIITEYYPCISKQVILFPLLHKELTNAEYELMKPMLESVFIIANDNNSSKFIQANIDTFLNE